MEDVLNKVMEQMNSVAKTKTVIGDPFKLGEFTCVPVIKIGVGFGSGGGGSEAESKGKKVEELFEEQIEGTEKVLLLDALEDGKFKFTKIGKHTQTKRGDIMMLMDGARSSYVFYSENGMCFRFLFRKLFILSAVSLL